MQLWLVLVTSYLLIVMGTCSARYPVRLFATGTSLRLPGLWGTRSRPTLHWKFSGEVELAAKGAILLQRRPRCPLHDTTIDRRGNPNQSSYASKGDKERPPT